MVQYAPPAKQSLKGLKIVPPPREVSLEVVADQVQYLGSPYHRTIPGRGGSPRNKPRGTKCPETLQKNHDRVERMLREAVRSGHCGVFEGGFPRRVWRRLDQHIYEARQGSPGSGQYHGYKLTPAQQEEFERRNAGF